MSRVIRASSLENSVSQFNTSISGNVTTCAIVPQEDIQMNAGAYTDMESLHVVLPLLFRKGSESLLDTKAIWGADFHELAHILFSPSVPVHFKFSKEYGEIYKIAEENRVEILFNMMFPDNIDILSHGILAATDSFGSAADNIDSFEEEQLINTFFLFCLRPWVGFLGQLRAKTVEVWGLDNVLKLEELVLEYCCISKYSFSISAGVVLDKIKELLPQNSFSLNDQHKCPTEADDHHAGSANDFDDASAIESFKDYVEEFGKEGVSKALGKFLEEATDGVEPFKSDFEFDIEAEKAEKEMDKSPSVAGNEGSDYSTYIIPVKGADRMAKKAIVKEMERIDDQNYSGYLKHVDSGSLMLEEVITPTPNLSSGIFKQWRAGKDDAADMEIVVLIDISGSMSKESIESAMGKVWSITKAVDEVSYESNTTVLAFDTECYPVYQNGQVLAENQIECPYANGGTDPLSALHKAQEILMGSLLPKKMLLVFTDGMWFSEDLCVKVIQSIKKNNFVSTGFMLYDYDSSGCASLSSHFDYTISSTDMDDFRKLGKTMVTSLMEV